MLNDPTFWVLVAFLLFIGVILYLKVPGKVGAALDERAGKIEADLAEAEKLREEAQDLLAAYERKQRDAAKEADKIIQHARDEALRMGENAARNLDETMQRREQQAIDRIARAETAALGQVRSLAVDLALDAAQGVIAEQISGKQAAAMIDAAIKDLDGKLN